MTADAADEPNDGNPLRERGNVMTSVMLKAIANPLRRRIINALNRAEHARAADLASQLDVAANTISFHLRVLADAGLIEEAPEHARDRRDRVWQVASLSALELGNPDHPMEDEAAGAAFTRLIIDEHSDLVRRVMNWAPEYTQGREDVMRGTFQQWHLRLTREEFTRALEKVNKVFDDAEKAHEPGAPDTLYWEMDIVVADETI